MNEIVWFFGCLVFLIAFLRVTGFIRVIPVVWPLILLHVAAFWVIAYKIIF